MSVHYITMEQGHKVARPVLSKEEYMKLRGSSEQVANLRQARSGNAAAKRRLVQMNYSCLPNDDGTLKGATRMTMSVGMDVDFDPSSPDYDRLMREAPETILNRREELGLLMLERSVNKGFHIVFRRHPELSQEENLRWASRLLGIEYDRGAKDLTRVFFTTGASEDDLLFLDEEIFSMDTQTDTRTDTHPGPPKGRERNYPDKLKDNGQSRSLLIPSPREGQGGLIRHLITLLGGEPAHGSRNSFIYTLACYLRVRR